MKRACLVSLGLLGALGCSTTANGEAGDETPGGSVNVTQGGAQDFAEFRDIVESGKVPSSSTLDPVGFFAEHALDMPPADCGKDVCVHPALAVAPRFDGGNWTMAYVTMNTAVKPEDLPHPPTHLVVVIERSSFTKGYSIAQAMPSLLAGLRPEDRVSVVDFSAAARVDVLAAAPDDPAIQDAADDAGSVSAATEVALYDGMAEAQNVFDIVDDGGFVGQHRVLLVTSGHATAGIDDADLVLKLGEGMVAEGTAFGVVGFGEDFDSTIPMGLGSMGAGTYAYAGDQSDLESIFEAEGETSLFPLATDFTLHIAPAEGYEIGRIYGVRRATTDASGATLFLPALFIGQRSGSADVGGGRRGGGGGLFVELRADPTDILANQPAFQSSADWTSATSGGPQDLQIATLNSLPPGENPDGMWWNISDGGDGKAFMMLNLYLAFRGTVELFEQGDCARSVGLVDMMQTSVGAWLGKVPDSDISEDNNLLLKLRENVDAACREATESSEPTEPIEPTSFEGGCCFL